MGWTVRGKAPKIRRPVANKSNQWHSSAKDYDRNRDKAVYATNYRCEICSYVSTLLDGEWQEGNECKCCDWHNKGNEIVYSFMDVLGQLKIVKYYRQGTGPLDGAVIEERFVDLLDKNFRSWFKLVK